jgi:hypothetical protein
MRPRLCLHRYSTYDQHRLPQAMYKLVKAIGLALPDHDRLPAHQPQLLCVLGIPEPVALQLRRPVSRVALWDVAFAAVVPVPKTPVDQHDYAPSGQHHVRLAGEVLPVQPEPVAHSVQRAANLHFRPGVPAGDTAHDLGPPRLAVNVCHCNPYAHRPRDLG